MKVRAQRAAAIGASLTAAPLSPTYHSGDPIPARTGLFES